MRILLADGRPKVRFALRVLLERQPQMQVVGEASNVYQLLAQVGMICPDLVLLGWELPGLATLGSLSSLHDACPGLSVIALSGRPEARAAALAAGADDFVSKADPPDRLLAAIYGCCTSDGNPWRDRDVPDDPALRPTLGPPDGVRDVG